MLRVAALALCLLLLAGCGLGEGDDLGGGAELRVTRDFGTELLASAELDEVREGDTVMRFLQAEEDVATRYGGGFVQSIAGLAGGGPDGRTDWFYFVNGVEADVGAADYALSPGDVVQWDYRDWDGVMRVPAIVGAYPEPFLHGVEGERVPTRVECEDDSSPVCEEVKRRLADAGVTATGAPFGAPAGEEVLRVVVGRWPAVRSIRAAQRIEQGPGASGVFARFEDGGSELALLDPAGERVEVAEPGTGLLAAVEFLGQQPVWVVTGVDGEGVEAAAAALEQRALADRFAVAADAEGVRPLPLEAEDVGGERAEGG